MGKGLRKDPDPGSERSKKRKKRGFVSLERSSRKHRRAKRRLDESATVGNNHQGSGGTLYLPGTKVDPPTQGKEKTFLATAGGAYNYH